MTTRQRSRVWGLAAGILLVTAACGSVALGLLAGIPLFDGLAPPPAYRWVHPPPELRAGNRAPASVSATVPLTDTGSAAAVVSTPDDQVQVSIPASAFPPAAGQTALAVDIRPLDPAQVPPPPAGMTIEGNAYRITVASVPSGATATAVQPVDVTLRYPVDATSVILSADGGWQVLPTTLESAALAVDATTTRFGIFAAASTGVTPSRPRRTPAWAYAAAGAALLAAGIPTLMARRRPQPSPSPQSPGKRRKR
ncbi:MAG TPA: hypothetical protein VG779_01115 [Actinomycetota bacterium]|jgi:hypothetical protein|nr:hypothetical protein [Actinomycetota bacterium]